MLSHEPPEYFEVHREQEPIVVESDQAADAWDTPYGRNVRYTVRFHVVGEKVDELGSMRPVDRHCVYRFVTPLGKLRAVALAAIYFAKAEPTALFREVELVETEHEFTIEAGDLGDDESRAR